MSAENNSPDKAGQKQRLLILFLWIAAGIVCVKSIFLDFGADNAYQIAMSYRHLSGDRMLLEIWEPHQTSIFLNDILMFLYHLVVPSYTGVGIYLQFCGTLLFVIMDVILYRTLKDSVDKVVLHAICVFLLVFRVKFFCLLK